MSNRVVMWLTGLVVLCIAVLLFLNALPFIWTPQVEKYLKYNYVRGMAIEHKNKLFTLNFDQQNEVIGYFNKSIALSKTDITNKKPKLEITKIIVYRFGSPDLTIVPMDYNNNNLIFASPDWNPDGLMQDISQGGLKNVLSQTYDPS